MKVTLLTIQIVFKMISFDDYLKAIVFPGYLKKKYE